jgi:hypothetical protein
VTSQQKPATDDLDRGSPHIGGERLVAGTPVEESVDEKAQKACRND